MSAVGIVTIALGLLIAVSRGSLVVFPAATLRWFEERIKTETRTRLIGIYALPVPGLMIWAGASEDSGLAGVLLILGLFMLVASAWLVLLPRSYMEFCGAFLPPEPGSNLRRWRMIGLLGVAFGAVFIYFGWLAL